MCCDKEQSRSDEIATMLGTSRSLTFRHTSRNLKDTQADCNDYINMQQTQQDRTYTQITNEAGIK